MDYCIYHSKDLDGLTSAAVISAHQLAFGEDCFTVGYDYGEKLDVRTFKGKATVMIDVSMDMDRMEILGQNAMEFIWIDHHLSAYEKLIDYCKENEYTVQENEYNSLIKRIEVKKMNMIFFYSSKISAAEIAANLYAKNLLKNSREIISLIGQYDTWRNSDESKLSFDKNWDNVVLPVQYYMRTCKNPREVYKKLKAFDNYTDDLSIDEAISIGKHILKYQLNKNESQIQKNLEFDFEGLNIVALNTMDANSMTFKDYYHESVHDAMMAFSFDGKKQKWVFTLFTTKDDVDILSIAKKYGGGGHSKACGFQLDPELVHFFNDCSIKVGEKTVASETIESIDIQRSLKFSKKGFSHFEKNDVDYLVPNIQKERFLSDQKILSDFDYLEKYEKYIVTDSNQKQ